MGISQIVIMQIAIDYLSGQLFGIISQLSWSSKLYI